MIFLCGGLALLSMMMTALNQQSFHTGSVSPGWMQTAANRSAAWVSLLFFKLAAVPLAVLVLFLIYRFLPNGRPPLKRVIAAAIWVGVLMELLKYAVALTWPGFQPTLARAYGVFQYSVTLILLGFLASLLVLAGAEWAARGHRMVSTTEAALHA